MARLFTWQDHYMYMYIILNQITFVKQHQLCDETDDCVYGEDEWPKAIGIGGLKRRRRSPGSLAMIDVGGICTAQ